MFSIKEALNKGWELTKNNFWQLLALFILSYLFYSLIYALSGLIFGFKNLVGENGPNIQYVLSNLLYLAITATVALNFFIILISLVRDGARFRLKDLFILRKNRMSAVISLLTFNVLITILAFLTGFFSGILSYGGFLLFIPLIYFIIRSFFASYLIAEHHISFIEALKKSFVMTKGIEIKMLGLLLATFGVMILGLLLLIVGVIPAFMVVMLAYTYVYVKLTQEHPHLLPHPQTHTE